MQKIKPNWRLIISALFLAILIISYLLIISASAFEPSHTDFLKFYISARFWLDDQSIYSPVTSSSIPNDIQIDFGTLEISIHPNLNHPIQTLFLSPLALFSYGVAFWIWSILSMIFGLLSIYLVFNANRIELNQYHVFDLTIPFLFFFPAFVTIISGQISTFLLFLLVIAWIAARRRSDQLAGITLGIAFSLKLFTGLFIPVLLFQKRWRLLAWYLGTFVVVNLFSIFVVGLEDHIAYLRTISSVTWYSATWNTSIMGFVTRLFGGSDSTPLVNSPASGIILYFALSIAILIFLLWSAYKSNGKEIQTFDLVFSLTIVSMLLISPLGWIYYYVLLILPVVVVWSAARRLKDRVLQGTIIAAWILCTIPYINLQGADIRIIDIFAWSGFPLYGLLLFFITLYILVRKEVSSIIP